MFKSIFITVSDPRVQGRTLYIMSAEKIGNEKVRNRWANLTTLVEVTSEVTQKNTGETAVTKRYYISDEDFPKAAYFNMLVRGHWSIENQLHWMLDVNFREDDSRARTMNASQNLSVMRKLALQNAKNYTDKASVKKKLFRASLDNDYMLKLITNYKF